MASQISDTGIIGLLDALHSRVRLGKEPVNSYVKFLNRHPEIHAKYLSAALSLTRYEYTNSYVNTTHIFRSATQLHQKDPGDPAALGRTP
jgi:hypothetical protein